MTAGELLAGLHGRGIELQAAGDRLRWRPQEALTDADRQALAHHKAEVLALLTVAVGATPAETTRPNTQAPAPPQPEPDHQPNASPRRTVERQGRLVKIEGVPGWLTGKTLDEPCGICGGTRFGIGNWRLFCPHCLRPRPGERVTGYLDVKLLKEG